MMRRALSPGRLRQGLRFPANACVRARSLPHPPRPCLPSPEQNSCGHRTASSRDRIHHGTPAHASLGASLPIAGASDRAGQRKEAGLRQATPPDKGRGGGAFSGALSSAQCVPNPYLCPTSELTRTLEGLPPTRSSGGAPALSDWLLCLTANSGSQPDGPEHFWYLPELWLCASDTYQ